MFKNISFFVVILLFSVTVSVNAQDSTSLSGKYALQFQISQNFTLGNFLGSVISGKYNCSGTSAIRIGVDFTTTMGNQSNGNHEFSSGYSSSNLNENNTQSIGVVAQYLWEAPLEDNIQFYYGVGPKLGFGFTHQNSANSSTSSSYIYYKQTSKNFSVGFLGSAGVEWFFSKKMSLCAEYGLAYLYNYTKNSINTSTSTEQTVRIYSYSLRSDNVRFGLSVYF